MPKIPGENQRVSGKIEVGPADIQPRIFEDSSTQTATDGGVSLDAPYKVTKGLLEQLIARRNASNVDQEALSIDSARKLVETLGSASLNLTAVGTLLTRLLDVASNGSAYLGDDYDRDLVELEFGSVTKEISKIMESQAFSFPQDSQSITQPLKKLSDFGAKILYEANSFLKRNFGEGFNLREIGIEQMDLSDPSHAKLALENVKGSVNKIRGLTDQIDANQQRIRSYLAGIDQKQGRGSDAENQIPKNDPRSWLAETDWIRSQITANILNVSDIHANGTIDALEMIQKKRL